MKSLALITALVLLPFVAAAERQARQDAVYEYQKDELQWDRKAFDSPPQIVGGYSDLVRRVSYPSELRLRRIEEPRDDNSDSRRAAVVTSVLLCAPHAQDLERIVTGASAAALEARGKHGKAVGGRVWFPVKCVVRIRVNASNQAMQLTASSLPIALLVSAVASVCCVACTEGSRQLILCLVRPMTHSSVDGIFGRPLYRAAGSLVMCCLPRCFAGLPLSLVF
jgi:hypothetical protein